jgi:hypothetical protein
MVALTIAPAYAGESPNIQICHATSSDTNPYNPVTVSKNSIVKGTGHGADAKDIIPSFTYAEKKDDPLTTFPGLNWTNENKTIYENSCAVPTKESSVAPVAPKFTQATCMYPEGVVTLQDQPEGVNFVFGPKLNTGAFGSTWTVAYAPAEGYKFTNGIDSGTFTFEIIPPGPGDPLWDAETNSCGLTNTGLGDMNPMILTLGGAAILGGALFFIVPTLTRRRKTA